MRKLLVLLLFLAGCVSGDSQVPVCSDSCMRSPEQPQSYREDDDRSSERFF
jgi:hypothetical protein